MSTQKRIGIYSGVFDPVHAGHIGFALQAMKAAKLDSVVFVPERIPRHKPGVTHFAHRVAMLTKALRPYKHMGVLELVDRHFTVKRTLPTLQSIFRDASLVLLLGSDAALTIPVWNDADRLMKACELVVGVRSEHALPTVAAAIEAWPVPPQQLVLLASAIPDVSSGQVRSALRANEYTKGLLTSVKHYARSEWLYVSLKQPQNS